MNSTFFGLVLPLLLALGTPSPFVCDAWTAVTRLGRRYRSAPTPTLAGGPPEAGVIHNPPTRLHMVGTGFSFEDGEQILVSVQKPFGIVLEQGGGDEDDQIVVTEVDPGGAAGRAGVRTGDVLVAVQNASTVSVDLAEVLGFIAEKCPRVVNLRFRRPG